MTGSLFEELNRKANEWASLNPGVGCPIGRYAASMPDPSNLSKQKQQDLVDVVKGVIGRYEATEAKPLSLHDIAKQIDPEYLERCYEGPQSPGQRRFTDFRPFDLAYFAAMQLVTEGLASVVSKKGVGFAYYLK